MKKIAILVIALIIPCVTLAAPQQKLNQVTFEIVQVEAKIAYNEDLRNGLTQGWFQLKQQRELLKTQQEELIKQIEAEKALHIDESEGGDK